MLTPYMGVPMPLPTEETLRTYFSREGIKPGRDLANYVLTLVRRPDYASADPDARAALLDRYRIRSETGISLAFDVYANMMVILLEKGVVDPAGFPERVVAEWRAERIDRQTRRLSGGSQVAELPTENPGLAPPPPPPEVALLRARIAFYEGVLSSVCRALGVPANPPEYAALLERLSNGL